MIFIGKAVDKYLQLVRMQAESADIRSIVENTLDGLLVLSETGQIVFNNKAAEPYLPIVQAFLSSTNLDELAQHAAQAEPFDMRGQLDSGCPAVLSARIIPIEWHGHQSYLVSLRDVTEQRQLQQELYESRELLRLVLDTVPIRIFWKDTDSRFLGCNLPFAEDAGLSSPQEMLGKTDYEMGWKDQAELYRSDDQEVMSTGQPKIGYEEPQTRPDGSTAWLRTSKLPLKRQDGEIVGVLGLYEDITERRALEAQLRQAQKLEAVGTLAGGIAHDFNNLLTAIIGNAEMALLEGHLTPTLRAYLEDIREAADRGARLTRQLLTFARRGPLEPKLVDLNDHILRAESMIRRLLPENIELVTRLAPAVHPVFIDPAHVDQILLNLVSNARDAMEDGGRLTIETENAELDLAYFKAHGISNPRPGSYAVLSVTDTGVGMSKEIQERIFEPFFTTKQAGTGTGLGLSTIYGIVKNAGGYIWCYSEPDKGTTMKVYLPKSGDEAPAQQDTTETQECPVDPRTVLVVEDDAPVRQLVVRSLAAYGYSILEATDPVEALQVASSHEQDLDLLVTDVVMPHMSGKELARRLREKRPDLQVLFISGYPRGLGDSEELIPDDVAYLQKPFSPSTLAAKVRELLRKSPRGS